MTDKEEKARQLKEAFASLAADQLRSMSDEDLARHAEGVVAMLEAIDAEYKRRNAIKEGKPDTGSKPIGRA